MNEQQAEAVAKALGGETWQSGGGIWLVIFRRADSRVVVISEEVVCEYENDDALDSGTPAQSIFLCSGKPT
jgi:hypothetical protein